MKNTNKTIKGTYEELNNLCKDLLTGGNEFYEFYGDIENALIINEDCPKDYIIEVELTGSEEAFKALKEYYGY